MNIRIIALFFLCIGMWWRVQTRYFSGFDGDEAFIITILSRPFPDLLQMLSRTEAASYLSGDFYLLFPFVKYFGPNKWALAFPHAILTVIGFYFLYRLCQIYFRTPVGYIVAFSFWAMNATLVRYALMARTYAVLPTLAFGSLYFLHCLCDHYETMRLRRKIGIALFLIVAIWWHAYGIVTVLVCALYCVLSKARDKAFIKRLPRLLIFFAAVGAVALPVWWYCISVGHHNGFSKDILQQVTHTFDVFGHPLLEPLRFTKNIAGNLVGSAWFLYFLSIGAVAAMILPQPQRKNQILFFLITVVLALEIVLLPSMASGYWFVQRHFIWVIALFAFWMGWCWDAVAAFMEVRRSLRSRRAGSLNCDQR